MLSESSAESVRKRAEGIASRQSPPGDDPQEKLIYELKVHQIELEMQNAELQNAQQDLLRAHQQYEILFDFAPVAYVVLNQDGTIRESNQAGAALLKTDKRYLRMKPFVVFLAREYHSEFFGLLRRVFDTAARQSIEAQLVNRNGDRIWTRIEARRRDDPDGTQRALTTIVDISDSKHNADELLLAKEEAQRSNNAKTAFIATLSHEIRTPMSGILSLAELALQTDLGPQQREYVNGIQSAAGSLMTMVDDVLDIARLESDQLPLERERFAPAELLQTLRALFMPSAQEKGIVLDIDPGTHLQDELVGDRNRIRQVLVNLLGNAIKFTARGTVSLRVQQARLSHYLWDLTFEVSDTGRGMSEQERNRVYDSFARAFDSDDVRYTGAGLGLTISRRLARGLGGQLYFESEPQRGSRFYFSVPLEIPEPDAQEAPRVAADPTLPSGTRALVAEDNPINALVMQTVLEAAGCTVVSVANGHEALDQLQQQRFDILLLDISMPGLDGLSTTERVRELSSADQYPANVPIVAISAHSMRGDRERFLASGIDDYISKPFSKRAVLTVVAKHLKAES